MEPFENRRVRARVISQTGTCVANHKVGDEFEISGMCPRHMCSWAFNTIFPYIQVLMCDGSFPWEKDKDTVTVTCPDPGSPVVFELRRSQRMV